jgi:antitoxin component HigA of HigAB toxin-antitoxin module
MPHLLDPKRIDTQASYRAALDELDALLAEEPGTSAGHRIDELFALIEAYEMRQPAQAPRAA